MNFGRTEETVLCRVGVFVEGEAMDYIFEVFIGSETMDDGVHIRFIGIVVVHSMKCTNIFNRETCSRICLPMVSCMDACLRRKVSTMI